MNDNIFYEDSIFNSPSVQFGNHIEQSNIFDDLLDYTSVHHTEPFEETQQYQKEPVDEQLKTCNKTKKIKKIAKQDAKKPYSAQTKNVCFNICQKCIKIIKSGEYEDKLQEICNFYGVDSADFQEEILKIKKNFTGPKALQEYTDKKTPMSNAFTQFLKWFLENKYLRYAFSGDMANLKVYITYKNEVMLKILQ